MAEKKLWDIKVAPIEGKSADFVIQWREIVVRHISELIRMKSAIDKIERSNKEFNMYEVRQAKIEYNELLDKGCSADL